MYNIKDKSAAIREIQRYLLVISKAEKRLPHVTVDGFYGDEMRAAVTEFQKISGIAPSGLVDYVTFGRIYERFVEITEIRKVASNVYSIDDFPLERGDGGNSVLILNGMLRILADYYEFAQPKDESFFSNETAKAVIYLKKVFGLPETEIVDVNFIGLLSDEILVRQKF